MRITFSTGSIISVIIGTLIFLFFFHYNILDPSNINWILNHSNDTLQHQMGSFAFRSDSWHFPITKTTQINHPEGISIVYTDSNPLLSIIAKLCRSFFPPNYQFWGIWYLLCFVLQSLFGYLIVENITKDKKYALLTSALFLLLPTIYSRIGHSNLLAHWLILASIYTFIRDNLSNQKKNIVFWLIVFIAAMIHAYLLFMVLFIFGTWIINGLIQEYKDKTIFTKSILLNIIIGLIFILFTWILGYFYNRPVNNGNLGFGIYSMNINSIINPANGNYNVFLPILKEKTGQYEGFQYLGLGLILLFLFYNIFFFVKEKIYNKKFFQIFTIVYFLLSIIIIKKFNTLVIDNNITGTNIVILYFWIMHLYFITKSVMLKMEVKFKLILIPAFICLFIALSNNIYVGEMHLLEIKMPSFFNEVLQKARSSGRFYWLTNLVFMTIMFSYLYKVFNKKHKIKYIILISAICIQLSDMHKVDIDLVGDNVLTFKKNKILSDLSKNTDNIIFLESFNQDYVKQLLLDNKKINDFYMAHGRGKITKKRYNKQLSDFRNDNYEKNSLYLFNNIESFSLNKKFKFCKIDDTNFTIPNSSTKNLNLKEYCVINKEGLNLKDLLLHIITDEIVILSVRDEATNNLSKEFIEIFDSKFDANLSKLKDRGSYIAIFENGVLINEKFDNENFVEFKGKISNHDLEVKSAGNDKGNTSIIKINKLDYSLNHRGINSVSVLKNDDCILTYSFDTHAKKYKY